MRFPFSAHSNRSDWRLSVTLLAALAAGACTPPVAPTHPDLAGEAPRLVAANWADLPGWADDDLVAAWPVFLAECVTLGRAPEWHLVCSAAASQPVDAASLRRFFEANFEIRRLENDEGLDHGLITGYYEPLLSGSRTRHDAFTVPLYGVPDDLVDVELDSEYPQLKGMRLRGRLVGRTLVPYASRAEIEDWSDDHVPLVWVDDAIAALFMEVQGSGRIRLADGAEAGQTIRLSFADQNGHPYYAIGRWLVERGELPVAEVSMQSITAWSRAHPGQTRALLDSNPSYIFFKEQPIADASLGPQGALGLPLTPLRSIAVDRRVVPLGSPVFLATRWPDSGGALNQLVFAQDTGGAIASSGAHPVRADLFFGVGDEAAKRAGTMKAQGRMWVLVPRGSGESRTP